MSFRLDPRIVATSRPIATLALCDARLQDDARWPWIVLVPRRAGAVEIEDLEAADQTVLMHEIVRAGGALRAVARCTGFAMSKLNVGALGNVTPQLHVHVVGRRPGDAAWPGPVWGVGEAVGYGPDAAAQALAAAAAAFV